jgi:hypothetical protein
VSDLKKPKEVKKEMKSPESDKKTAKATEKLLQEIRDRQSTDSNNDGK